MVNGKERGGGLLLAPLLDPPYLSHLTTPTSPHLTAPTSPPPHHSHLTTPTSPHLTAPTSPPPHHSHLTTPTSPLPPHHSHLNPPPHSHLTPTSPLPPHSHLTPPHHYHLTTPTLPVHLATPTSSLPCNSLHMVTCSFAHLTAMWYRVSFQCCACIQTLTRALW